MKYDRPVRELLDECARSLAEPFTRAEILDWFRRHYPDVKQNTVQSHIFGLTDSDAPSREYHQLGDRKPVLERVDRGLYRRWRGGTVTPPRQDTPPRSRARHLAEAPPVAPVAGSTADVVLVGCVKSKRTVASPAKDLYVGSLFARRRRYAEASGAPWFVVSSRWGLVAPDEVVAPYDVYLGDMPATYRRAWGAFVVEQLRAHASLSGAVVEIHAGDHYVDALRATLEQAGAVVVDPVDAHSMGETLAWYDRAPSGRSTHPTDAPEEADVDALVATLRDETAALTPTELRTVPRATLAAPGLYSWWVDDDGAADLARGLGLPLEPGLIYAGQAGATRRLSGRRSTNTLAGRLLGMHLGGRADLSTFRLTLGAILWPQWGGDVGEPRLTAWMERHLRVVAVPFHGGDTLDAVETAVLHRLDPPLNLAKMARTPLRDELTRLRRRYVRRA